MNTNLFHFCLALGCLLLTPDLTAQHQALLREADSLSYEKQYAAANDRLKTFINTYPQRKYDLGEAFYLYAQNSLYLNELNQADAYNKESAALRSGVAPDALGWNEWLDARIDFARGRYREALSHAEEAANYPYFDDPLLPAEIALLQSKIYEQTGDTDQAIQAVESARQIATVVEGPRASILSRIHLQQALLLAIQEQWAASIKASRAAMAIADSPEAYLSLGQSLLASGDLSQETRAYLALAQDQGNPGVQIRAGLALARLALAEKQFQGALAQLDRTALLVNETERGKGNQDARPSIPHSAPAAARIAYLRSCAWLLDSTEAGAANAFDAAIKGIQLLDGRAQPSLKLDLLENGFLALLRQQEEGRPAGNDKLKMMIWDWAQQYLSQQKLKGSKDCEKLLITELSAFQQSLSEKSAAVFFLSGTRDVFSLFTTNTALQLQLLERATVDEILNRPEGRTGEGIPKQAYSAFLHPLELYGKTISELLLLTPGQWPEEPVISLPVPTSLIRGIWPFRPKRQSLNERYNIRQHCSFRPIANLKSQERDIPPPH